MLWGPIVRGTVIIRAFRGDDGRRPRADQCGARTPVAPAPSDAEKPCVTKLCRLRDFLIDALSELIMHPEAMAGSPNVSTEDDLCRARAEVLSVLRTADPTFLAKCSEATLRGKHAEIAKMFLNWIGNTAFALEIVTLTEGSPVAFEGRWTHSGDVFVGFRQPPAALNRDDAAILACAALLRNDWCRARLPKL